MLRPGLRQHLQLDVGRLAAFAAIVVADRPHLGQIERQAALLAERQQPRVVRGRDRDDLDRVGVGLERGKRRRDRLVERVGLDDGVRQEAFGQALRVGPADGARDLIAPAGGRAGQSRHADQPRAGQEAFGHAVGDAGAQRDFDGVGLLSAETRRPRRFPTVIRLLRVSAVNLRPIQGPDDGLFDDRIIEEDVAQASHRGIVQVAFQEVKVADGNGRDAGDAQGFGLATQAFPACVGESGLGGNLNAIEHTFFQN